MVSGRYFLWEDECKLNWIFLIGSRKQSNLGAGEILFTSMDHDGTKNGFANETLKKLSEMVKVPIIASGGAGNMQHFCDTFKEGKADAALGGKCISL